MSAPKGRQEVSFIMVMDKRKVFPKIPRGNFLEAIYGFRTWV